MSELTSHAFPDTHWTLVGRAGAGDTQRREALGNLLAQYVGPLRSFLSARFGVPRDRAEDLLHGFLADKVLEQDLVRQADRARGRFRSFLLRSLENFTIAQIRKERSSRRSPDSPMWRLDFDEAAEPPAPAIADEFDAAWGKRVIDLALQAMHQECLGGARADLWTVFDSRVLRPTLQGEQPVPLSTLVEQLGVTPAKASNLLITSKRMFARHLREIISEYAVDVSEVEDELRHLKLILARARA